MPSLITKWKKGKPYLYWVRSAWVNGHSRIVEQLYLGPRERVMEQMHAQFTSASHKEIPALRTVQIREFGASALFYAVAQELGLIELINAHVPPAPPGRRTSLSVGHYLVLAAINRAAWPKSKRAFAEWYQGTVLARLVPALPDELRSQRFWDHMNLFIKASYNVWTGLWVTVFWAMWTWSRTGPNRLSPCSRIPRAAKAARGEKR